MVGHRSCAGSANASSPRIRKGSSKRKWRASKSSLCSPRSAASTRRPSNEWSSRDWGTANTRVMRRRLRASACRKPTSGGWNRKVFGVRVRCACSSGFAHSRSLTERFTQRRRETERTQSKFSRFLGHSRDVEREMRARWLRKGSDPPPDREAPRHRHSEAGATGRYGQSSGEAGRRPRIRRGTSRTR